MNILKEDQKKHAHELHETFLTLHEFLLKFSCLVEYFYGEDSEVFKNYHEKAESIFYVSKDIESYVREKYES
jgi:hypothetical protein